MTVVLFGRDKPWWGEILLRGFLFCIFFLDPEVELVPTWLFKEVARPREGDFEIAKDVFFSSWERRVRRFVDEEYRVRGGIYDFPIGYRFEMIENELHFDTVDNDGCV